MSKEGRPPGARRTGRLSGHKGLHLAGSRKGRVHQAFDEEGSSAAKALAEDLGIKDTSFRTWSVKFRQQAESARSPVNLSLDGDLVSEARALEINLSRAAEAGIAAEVMRVRAQQWREQNQLAIESSNDYVETHGLPLDKHRMF